MGNHNIITAWTEIISFSLENRIKWYGETIGETASASIASTTKVNLDM